MGNCVFKGFRESELEAVKVVTSSGGIMELFAPITVDAITNEFPGHAIFRSRDLFSQPLLHNDELHPGELYYLLPLNPYKKKTTATAGGGNNDFVVTPYRMSCEGHGAAAAKNAARRHHNYPEVVPRYNSSGVWKVKLVISPEQLSEILSQEARTEALIESVRTVAKCGNGSGSGSCCGASSVASSDQWSISGSWKGS